MKKGTLLVVLMCVIYFSALFLIGAAGEKKVQPVKVRALASKVWVIHGQTTVNAGSYADDPVSNMPGSIGEEKLPYTVPDGKKLVILAQGCEGTPGPLSALFPWLGDYPPHSTAADQAAYRKANALFSVASNGGSRAHGEIRFILPAGTKMHIRLTNGASTGNWVLAWFIRGVLIDDTDDETLWLK